MIYLLHPMIYKAKSSTHFTSYFLIVGSLSLLVPHPKKMDMGPQNEHKYFGPKPFSKRNKVKRTSMCKISTSPY